MLPYAQSGQNNVVVELKFSDSTSGVARIRLRNETVADDAVEPSILTEVAVMGLMSSKTSIPVVQVHGFDVSLPNNLRYRYLLMEAVSGFLNQYHEFTR